MALKTKISFLITICLLCSCAQATSVSVDSEIKTQSTIIDGYNAKIMNCDTEADKKSDNPEYYNTNGGMRRVVYEQIDCYKNIAINIIEENYTQNKIETLNNLSNFMKSAAAVASDIYYPDSCNPACGTDARLESVEARLEIVRSYVNILIQRQDPPIY
jgi:hypothetical protein